MNNNFAQCRIEVGSTVKGSMYNYKLCLIKYIYFLDITQIYYPSIFSSFTE